MRVIQETPKITQAITKVLGYLPELENKTLLFKTVHTSDTELGVIEQDLTWKTSTSSSVLIMLDNMHTAKKENQSLKPNSHTDLPQITVQ